MSAKNITNISYRKVYYLGWVSASCAFTFADPFNRHRRALMIIIRFYPSLPSISTHFSKYRATALGAAVAGASVGAVV